ncbi:hypothetical protein L3X38_011116 [Prunus dulcis]|uniref:Reverse transcriptase domain-containing protein n=1 Tax=Prunus dulcis TaxID=3755 RepID=A0AAD4ZEQ7_PRUDU|nr:hypothetical protein L3X38_011116 [Prunus dulcis]
MAWKIDLSKAYDKLNWHFIEVVLAELGLPADLRRLIMHCVSTVKYQICINGKLTNSFTPMNGIRQGGPLSPYLFVLCVEKLSHIIFDLVQKGRATLIQAVTSSIPIYAMQTTKLPTKDGGLWARIYEAKYLKALRAQI